MTIELAEVLNRDTVFILDGAMGTELARRGVDISLPLWSAGALNTAPETVLAIHRDYIAAGARIITANTFRTTTFTYRRTGLDRADARRAARAAAHQAVSVARRAADESTTAEVLVAGSLAPVADCYTPEDYPGLATARDTYRELAAWLAEDSVDVLLLETHITLEEARLALEAATGAGLPILASFLVDAEMKLCGGAPLKEAVALAEGMGAQAVLVNCVTLPVAGRAAAVLSGIAAGSFGLYANAGHTPPSRDGTIKSCVTDQAYAEAASRWAVQGARLVGGCCGTTPATIRALHNRLRPAP